MVFQVWRHMVERLFGFTHGMVALGNSVEWICANQSMPMCTWFAIQVNNSKSS